MITTRELMRRFRELTETKSNPSPERLAEVQAARASFLEFCKFVRPGFQVNWHHHVICEHLQRWIEGDIMRLMLFAPPRAGKSELVSRCLPAYLFGKYPDSEIISSSHTASLATELSTDMQGIMDSDAYRELFPDVRLKRRGSPSNPTDYRANNRFSVLGHRGRFFCCGVGGPIVGRGFDFGIIDDPIADREQAHSPVQREKINRWYPTKFATRMLPGARILLMHQRWHIQDLAGMLRSLESADSNADRWTVLSFPAVAEDSRPTWDPREPGQALWPERYPLEYLKARQAENVESDWLAIYQQRPTTEGGNHFKSDWFNACWVERPDSRIAVKKRAGHWQEWHTSDCMRYGIVDPASTAKPNSDHTALGAFLQTPDGDLLVLDITWGKWSMEQIPTTIRDYSQRHGLAWIGVEANGFQVAIVLEVRRLGSCPVRELSHRGKGKLVRATPAMIQASNGFVVLPQEAKWKREFLETLSNFTGNEGDVDDVVDCLAYAVLEQSNRDAYKRKPDGPPKPEKKDTGTLPPPITRGGRSLFG